MSAKPESTFILSVHKKLPHALHKEKMHNPYRGGTADCWYSGSKGDLWIEYKFVPKIPVKVNVEANLSDLQKQWLEGRSREGRRVAVIIGCKEGGVICTDFSWLKSFTPDAFRKQIRTRDEIAAWILSLTGEPA